MLIPQSLKFVSLFPHILSRSLSFSRPPIPSIYFCPGSLPRLDELAAEICEIQNTGTHERCF
jgi:hypothetical protein